MTFLDTMGVAERPNNLMLNISLDPEPVRPPTSSRATLAGFTVFCAYIVDGLANLMSAFKPPIAYLATHRAKCQLERLMRKMRRLTPQVPIILDAKRANMAAPSSSTRLKLLSATVPIS